MGLAFGFITFGAMSCGQSKSSTAQDTEKDTTKVECKSDTCDIDTSVVTRGGSDSKGFGRCLVSGCYCKEFEGRGQTCRNCGHAYRKHY